ncbi:hypothetical protein, partial [Sphingobacterium sp. IITKGP-BTPF85]|uniref:hypothetical protein n=1 Tax=Sphingobacterium sp. IITKGP-BTPF85 TaxID=1338009 RepID=UPI001E56BE76
LYTDFMVSPLYMFQFLYGAIKGGQINKRLITSQLSFNSCMVRLKAEKKCMTCSVNTCFNSCMVRLKDRNRSCNSHHTIVSIPICCD